MGSRLEKNSNNVSKRFQNHSFSNEDGEEYSASKFAGFGDYMRRKKIKLQNLDAELRSQSTDKPQIFRGIVAHVNGYTQPSLQDLHREIVSHGGVFLQYLDGKTACTHIIASQLTPKKKAEFAKYRIVKPAWVVDSVRAGRLLPWDNYRVVDEGVTQKILGFDNGNFVSQANRQQQSYRSQTDSSWYTSQIKKSSIENADEAQVDGFGESKDSTWQPVVANEISPTASMLDYDEEEIIDLYDNADASLISPIIEPSAVNDTDTSIDSHQHAAIIPASENLEHQSSVLDHEVVPQPFENPKTGEKRKLTAEEHNEILLQNPHLAKSSTANPDFLNQYYRESRLHHLSTWKAELKAQLQARAIEKSASQKSRQKRSAGARRYVMHVDFDSFFAAVSLRKNPHLIDKPVVIAHGSGPGSEIASCNYPARAFGVKNGMWMKSALELCPHLKVLPYDFKAYEEASRHFYDSMLDIDGTVQSISIDEALIDVSDQCIKAGSSDGKDNSDGILHHEQAKANEIADTLRFSVRTKTGCEVSVGIGGNILLAKLALRKAKPAGQYLVKPDEVLSFVGEFSVMDLPGVAYSLGNKLEELGVKNVKDIRTLNKERLINALGPKTGEKMWDYSRGIDKVEVGDQVVRKSVSAEINWGIRFVTQQQAEDFVQCLCDELQRRLLENGVKGKQLTVKIMRKAADAGMDPPKNLGHGKCDTFNKSVVLGVSTNDKDIIGKEAISVLRGYGFSPGELRGLGVQMQKLEPIKPLAVTGPTPTDSSQRRLQFKKFNDSTTPGREQKKGQPSHTPVKTISEPVTLDSIDDFPTPEKPKVISTIHGGIDQTNMEGEKPLNIIGTQFMLPSQIDPTVLAELPADIRSKLAPKQRTILDKVYRDESPTADLKSRSASPYLSDTEYGLPSQSQLDPEALAALPEELRDELMAHYRNKTCSSSARRHQQVLPQSPRKLKPISNIKKTQLTPTKKQKTSSLIGKGRPKTKGISFPTLTQSNFISMANPSNEKDQAQSVDDQEISKSFLEELPEDIRLEILAEQKRNRLKSKSGLNLGTNRKKTRTDNSKSEFSKGQQKLHLPDIAKKPTFTSRKLSTLPDLRDAMSAWVQEFSGVGEEGPFEEDATALGQYLQKVILDEADMAKAVSVIEWLEYLVSDWPFEHDIVRAAWHRIISLLKNMTQDAVGQRGLPPLEFGAV